MVRQRPAQQHRSSCFHKPKPLLRRTGNGGRRLLLRCLALPQQPRDARHVVLRKHDGKGMHQVLRQGKCFVAARAGLLGIP